MTKPQSREKAEKIASKMVEERYSDCISPVVFRCECLVNVIADALTPQLELLAECERVLQPFLRENVIKGKAGLYIAADRFHQLAALIAKIKEVGK